MSPSHATERHTAHDSRSWVKLFAEKLTCVIAVTRGGKHGESPEETGTGQVSVALNTGEGVIFDASADVVSPSQNVLVGRLHFVTRSFRWFPRANTHTHTRGERVSQLVTRR